jgi:hypothetical protein
MSSAQKLIYVATQSLRFSHIITRYEEIDYRHVADCHGSNRSAKPQSV